MDALSDSFKKQSKRSTGLSCLVQKLHQEGWTRTNEGDYFSDGYMIPSEDLAHVSNEQLANIDECYRILVEKAGMIEADEPECMGAESLSLKYRELLDQYPEAGAASALISSSILVLSESIKSAKED